MPPPNSTVAHEYDPNVVFHNHSSNIPHLNSWIDELIKLTENALPSRDHPTTEQLVEALHRYDSVFRELISQTAIHSEPLTRMYAKTWAGNLKLLDYMIKAYHRYVKHTSHLQEQAQSILKDKRGQMAAAVVKEEEHELERTALRAKIRNLQAEVDIQKATVRGMERENAQLRTIIDVYIRAQEMNETVWEMMDADEAEQHEDVGLGDELIDVPVRKYNNVDSSRNQLRTLCRLDVEMNECLSGIVKEESRQQVIVNELTNTLHKYQDVFGKGHMTAAGFRGGEKSVLSVSKEIGIQVDEKDAFGCVLDSTPEPKEDWFYDVLPPAPSKFVTNGAYVPYRIRSCMSTYPRVLRIPPVDWTNHMIVAIYFDKIRCDQSCFMLNRPREDMPEFVFSYFCRLYGIEAVAEVQTAQLLKAIEQHLNTSKRVGLFASMIGMYDKEAAPSMDLRDVDFILCIIAHLLRLGELQPEKPSLKAKRSASITTSKSSHASSSSFHFRPEVRRENAVITAQTVFEKLVPDGGADYIAKLRTAGGVAKGPKYIDIDDVIEILVDLWQIVRLSWEDHARYLYKQYCSTFRISTEAQFETDEVAKERDTILVEVSKEAVFDSIRRPIRLFMRREANAHNKEGHGEKEAIRQQGNPNKEPIAEAMTRKNFYSLLAAVNNQITKEEADKMFDEGLAWSYAQVMRTLELLWQRCQDERGRDFYFNVVTHKTQWSKPYHSNTFVCTELEIDAFVHVLLINDVLAKSQFVELMHVAPKDLWPNSEVFLKQLQANATKKKTKANKINIQKLRANGGSISISVGSPGSINSQDTYQTAMTAASHALDGYEGKTTKEVFDGVVVPELDMQSLNSRYADNPLGSKEEGSAMSVKKSSRGDGASVSSGVTAASSVTNPQSATSASARDTGGASSTTAKNINGKRKPGSRGASARAPKSGSGTSRATSRSASKTPGSAEPGEFSDFPHVDSQSPDSKFNAQINSLEIDRGVDAVNATLGGSHANLEVSESVGEEGEEDDVESIQGLSIDSDDMNSWN